MRYLYTLLFYLLLPFIFLRLWWRGRAQPDYRKRMLERLGFYPFQLEKSIWIHAVSVGESIAAIPLIKSLQSTYRLPIVVTTMTPTGAAQIKASFGDSVIHAYLPYDVPDAIHRFLNAINPQLGIIMETELWPNLIAACKDKQIPVCLLNARLSEKSARGYQRFAKFSQAMLQNLTMIVVQNETDATRFVSLGISPSKIAVTGNIKFDLALPEDLVKQSTNLKKELGQHRLIWIAASTHEGEEEILLAAHQVLLTYYPNAMLILVPRHPHRFHAVAELCERTFKTVRRTQQNKIEEDTQVYLADTMGELLYFYQMADIVFVGGSLKAIGGHNLLEPAALSKPILSGIHLFNFAEISHLLTTADALIKVNDANTLASQLVYLSQHPEERQLMGQRALQVVAMNRGALTKQLSVIEKYLQIH